jgi:hypothetical protein
VQLDAGCHALSAGGGGKVTSWGVDELFYYGEGYGTDAIVGRSFLLT